MTKVAVFVTEDVCPLNFILAAVASAEANSNHPVASAITKYVKEVSQIFQTLAIFVVMWIPFPIIMV